MLLAIIQARMGSKRYPGKMMVRIDGKSIIQHCIENVKKLHTDKIFVLINNYEQDHDITKIASKNGIDCDMEIPSGLLFSYYYYGMAYDADYILRVCADAPFFDVDEVNRLIDIYHNNPDKDYYAYWHKNDEYPTVYYYPNGNYKEIIACKALNKIVTSNDLSSEDVNNVTSYIYKHSQQFDIYKILINKLKYTSSCLDYPADLKRLKRIYKTYYYEVIK